MAYPFENYTTEPKTLQKQTKILNGHTPARVEVNSNKYLKIGIWCYFLLLIFEGALRKWGIPALSAPLLVVRDPVAIWLIYSAWKKDLFPFTFYPAAMIVLGITGMCATLVVGHGNLAVALFGARILLLHFPLMFVIGNVFNREDVIKLGKAILGLSIPLVVLTAMQFYSPQSAFVNMGVGGDAEGSGFSGAMGFFRPSGTFSFTTGNSMFFSLVACFVLFFWVSKVRINRILLAAATLAVLASIPLSISRSLFFSIAVAIIFTGLAISRNPQYLSRMLMAAVCMVLLLTVLSQTSFFQTATAAFVARFESASSIEGGVASSLIERYFGSMITAISGNNGLPFFGYGLGLGTNAGSAMLTGERSFLIAEGEWARLIGEMGFVIGMLVILLRLVFCLDISIKSYKSLQYENLLPWILLSFALITIPQGQWAQPTALGFSTLIGGLVLGALKVPEKEQKSKGENIKVSGRI
ncbi:hypothetical protein [Autumnicola musiva]|uniref:O-antigen ligase domain-containing protein n=1 Tax=Autumnicola musiva TaxID=3075589 RepID=A0ABU3D2S4_9FLAO|nr:hypothetical protein [Zunongwangia sp. F117]MDT0675839.1 hypothetical protein [Zunongwangia sp. F117]